jgi:hypothetical protein
VLFRPNVFNAFTLNNMKRVARALGGFIPFSSLSRHQQRDAYIKLRGRINRTKGTYGPNFTSYLVLNELGRQAVFNVWFHFYFLGLDGHTIWNTYLFTAGHDYWEKISSLAHDEADQLNPRDASIEWNFKDWFVPVYDSAGRKIHSVMRESKPVAALGGLTRLEFLDDCAARLIKEDTGSTVQVFEAFEIQPNYEYGIGIRAVMDAPEINREAIETMIAKFRAMGEQSWKCSVAIPRDRLPRDTQLNLARSDGAL